MAEEMGFASNVQFNASATQWPWSLVRGLASQAAIAKFKAGNFNSPAFTLE